ncbi:hypothetical protein DRZ78_01540 [Candidatus Aerophobetes bacterium]|uniref:Uncharacterized protein n=1 Tax=Aerophobetes bacterium TaxID=2030807 RepID=A0A662D4S6_UNCAE|nr:MAG: hypothetical protein DRZ78_01540 [Candidatus Aerophobetes bacterium]
MSKTEKYKNNGNRVPDKTNKFISAFSQPVSPRAIAVAVALVFVSGGLVFGYPYLEPTLNSVSGFIKDASSQDVYQNLTREVDENLILPLANVFSFFRDRPQPEMTFTEYVQNDIQNLKNFFGKVNRAISYPFVKSYQFVVRLWKEKIVIMKERTQKEKLLPKPGKEGLVVIPSTIGKDKEMEQKIKASFSDEIKIQPKDETSGIIIPIFREIEGDKYLYILVPVKE